MKILVTGGAGFIGNNFIRYMLEKYLDYKIVNYDKLTYAGNLDNLKDLKNNSRHSFVLGDINDRDDVSRCIGSSDVVINFAAESHVDRSIDSADEFIKTNIVGAHNLFNIALQKGCEKFIHISTDEVYGSIINNSSREGDVLKPNSPYSASKASADLILRSHIQTYNFPGIVVRMSNNYGMRQYPEKFIPVCILNALANKKIPIYGDGLYQREWIYVLDACEAIDVVLHKGKVGEIYNIGSNERILNIDLVKMILKVLGKPLSLIKYVEDRKGHDRGYWLDSSKIKNELGWSAKYEFEDALKLTVDWYKENTEWWKRLLEK